MIASRFAPMVPVRSLGFGHSLVIGHWLLDIFDCCHAANATTLRVMKTNRRHFLKTASLGAGALGLLESAELSAAVERQTSFLTKPPRMKLGTVTYNLAQDWDIETIIKNCEAARFDGVELRTGHAHKVEVALSTPEREQVKQRFANSK